MALKISEITATVTDITKETLVEVSEKTGSTYTTKKFNLQGLAKVQHTHGYDDLTGVAPSAHTHALNNLSDVEAPTASSKILAWDGTTWKPIDIPTGGGGGEGASSLGDLSDVDIATKSDGDVLTYVASASKWKAVAPSTGGGASSLADLSDVDIGTKTDGDALVYVGADEEWQAVNLRKVNEVIKSSTATLTTAEVTGTIINNYGQSDDTTLTLPTATKGLTFMIVLGTEVSKYFRIKPDTNDKIYLSGTAGADGEYVGVSSAEAGNTISFTSFKTGTDTYDWLAIPIAGDWEAES